MTIPPPASQLLVGRIGERFGYAQRSCGLLLVALPIPARAHQRTTGVPQHRGRCHGSQNAASEPALNLVEQINVQRQLTLIQVGPYRAIGICKLERERRLPYGQPGTTPASFAACCP